MHSDFNDSMTLMKKNLHTIADLLTRGSLEVWSKNSQTSPWIIKPLYEDKSCSVGLVTIRTNDLVPCEEHIHPESNEYLIVTKGSLLLTIDDRVVRIVREGECCSVPMGSSHYSKPVSADTEFIYVCVPRDTAIPLSLKEKKD